MNGLDRITQCIGQLRHLQAGVGRIAAAVIKEITDVMCLEYLDQAFIFTPVLLEAFQFVAAGAECAGGCMTQRSDRRNGVLAGINQVFGQGADNAVTASINFADFAFLLARGFNQTGGRCINDCGDPAGLGIKSIFCNHNVFS